MGDYTLPSNEGTSDPNIGQADADGAEGLWNPMNPETPEPGIFIVGSASGGSPGVPS